MRFAFSPLAEAAEALYMLHSGRVPPSHQGWFEAARPAIKKQDNEVLQAVLPARGDLAHVFLLGARDATTTINDQLRMVAEYPPDRLTAELGQIWQGVEPPPAVPRLLAAKAAGMRQLAELLGAFWTAAIEPYWHRMRALLDADVAYRASRMTEGGIAAMVSDLHPALAPADTAFEVRSSCSTEYDLTGQGLLLVPSVFAWPWLYIDVGHPDPPSLTYGARGVGTLWETSTPREVEDDALTAMLGRSRAAILENLAVPRTTTDLARKLGQSPATTSAHLAILRRCGMVTSWPAGRRVFYQRTPLATSVMIASGNSRALRAADTA